MRGFMYKEPTPHFRFVHAAPRRARWVTSGLAAALLSTHGFAQEPEEVQVRLPEAVLTAEAAPDFEATVTQTTLDGDTVQALTPVNNYNLLRMIPGVTGGLNGKDRFGGPVSIRGGVTWGVVEAIDGYPSIDVVPVAAEDGGYTANISSIIPSIALAGLSVETGALGVAHGQATGGVIRSRLKRGDAANPYSTLHAEYNTVGEAVFMAETSGGHDAWDYYGAIQTVRGDYGDAYETHSRPLQELQLYSGLAKIGYRPSEEGRFELLAVGGVEDHDYYRERDGARTNYHTEKENAFVGVRYDHVTSAGLRWDVGATLNNFHETRINEDSGQSERNRPQRAFKLFANLSDTYEPGQDWRWVTIHGVEYTDDYFSDITGEDRRFDFGETSAYTRHSLTWREWVTFNAGLRAARIDNGFRNVDELAHNVGLAIDVPRVGQIHFSHYSGYRLNKAFYLWWGGGSNIERDPAQGLDPSESETWEIGWRREFTFNGGIGHVRLTYFETTESHLFNFGNTGTGVPYYDEGESQGFEAWAEWNPRPEIRLFAGYSHLGNRRVDSTNPDASNLDLRFTPIPEDTASVGLSWQFAERWQWTLAGNYDSGAQREFYDQGVREIEQFASFFRIDTALAWQVNDRWMLFGRIENLLNEKDLGYTAVRQESDGTSTRNEATQEDPGILFAFGGQLRF